MWKEIFVALIEKLVQPPSETEREQHQDMLTYTARRSKCSAGRKARLYNEFMMIAPNFSKHEGIYYDEKNCDWLIIPKYPLPEKWRNRWCKLLIVFPETYPVAPPIGFYLNRKFRLKYGDRDPHLTGSSYDGAPNLQAQGWHWYCVRMEKGSAGGWKPFPDYRRSDNLWTFLTMVRESLTNDY